LPMTKIHKGLIAGIFYQYACTLKAYQALCENGYENSEICIVMTLETWKELFLDVLDGVYEQKPNKHVPFASWQHLNNNKDPAKMKALICSSSIMQGPGIMLAGPISNIHSRVARNGIDITKVLQKWGLSEALSVQYEEELLCGGIMIGTQCRLQLQDKTIADQWRTNKCAFIHQQQAIVVA
ncbi:MAG: hypothetical protein ABR574_12455, partial [Cryomorphaceae bacterium]